MKKGTKLVHYKGGKYTVLGKGKHTETEEEMVIYESNADKKVWIRPLEMFQELVEYEGEEKIRFKKTQKERLNMEYKAKAMGNCDCCGNTLVERIYLNGKETEYKDFILEKDKEVFDSIVEEYNKGIRFFEIQYIVTKEDDGYFIINGKQFEATMYALTLEKFLEIINVVYKIQEIELK